MSTYMNEVDYFAGRAQYYLRRANEDADDVLRRAHEAMAKDFSARATAGDRNRMLSWSTVWRRSFETSTAICPVALARKHSQPRTPPRMDRDHLGRLGLAAWNPGY